MKMKEHTFAERVVMKLRYHHLLDWLPDKQYLQLMYWAIFHKRLDLKNPKGFNEKLQWLKLYDRRPEYTVMVDKYAAKQYVAARIGEQYIIPTLGVWEHFDDIDFDSLPNQFVLKCTHDSGGLVVCKDKQSLDKTVAKEKIEKSLKRNYYWSGREWPYKNVPPRIIAEKYMSNNQENNSKETSLIVNEADDLKDYKFYCFNGTMKFVMINSDRNSDKPTKADYFDRDFNWLDFTWGYAHAEIRPEKPEKYEEMVFLAEKLSKGLPHIRVDFYECNGKVYFGELTFYDGSGFDAIEPIEWEYKIGKMINLPI